MALVEYKRLQVEAYRIKDERLIAHVIKAGKRLEGARKTRPRHVCSRNYCYLLGGKSRIEVLIRLFRFGSACGGSKQPSACDVTRRTRGRTFARSFLGPSQGEDRQTTRRQPLGRGGS